MVGSLRAGNIALLKKYLYMYVCIWLQWVLVVVHGIFSYGPWDVIP